MVVSPFVVSGAERKHTSPCPPVKDELAEIAPCFFAEATAAGDFFTVPI
jgi:hypothetical protein